MIKIEYSNSYEPNIDVLIRVYENQGENPPDKELFCGEILFNTKINKYPIRFSAAFPRGLVEAMKEHLNTLKQYKTLRVSNELPYQFHHLTSCRENFDIRFKNELVPMLKLEKSEDFGF